MLVLSLGLPASNVWDMQVGAFRMGGPVRYVPMSGNVTLVDPPTLYLRKLVVPFVSRELCRCVQNRLGIYLLS